MTNCQRVISSKCPSIIKYTKEEQHELKVILEKENNLTLYRFIKNYGELRMKIKICNGK